MLFSKNIAARMHSVYVAARVRVVLWQGVISPPAMTKPNHGLLRVFISNSTRPHDGQQPHTDSPTKGSPESPSLRFPRKDRHCNAVELVALGTGQARGSGCFTGSTLLQNEQSGRRK